MRPHPLRLVDGTGERIRPFLRPGEGDVWAEIWHEDLGPLTLIGYWKEGFRDSKTLLGLTQNMNRQRLWGDVSSSPSSPSSSTIPLSKLMSEPQAGPLTLHEANRSLCSRSA